MDTKEPIQDSSILPEINEETTPLTPERIKEFTTSLGGDVVEFLDSINSVEELEQIRTYIEKNNIDIETSLLDWYRENLERWKEPQKEITEGFREFFPLTSNKLDTPQKMRIFLRFADFCRVNPFPAARVTESIIHQHEIEGKGYVEFPDSGFLDPQIPEKLAYFTQIPAWTARKLLLPGLKRSGSRKDLFFDWREQELEQ